MGRDENSPGNLEELTRPDAGTAEMCREVQVEQVSVLLSSGSRLLPKFGDAGLAGDGQRVCILPVASPVPPSYERRRGKDLQVGSLALAVTQLAPEILNLIPFFFCFLYIHLGPVHTIRILYKYPNPSRFSVPASIEIPFIFLGHKSVRIIVRN